MMTADKSLSIAGARALLSFMPTETRERIIELYIAHAHLRPDFMAEVRLSMLEDYGSTEAWADQYVDALLTLARARAH